MSKELIIINQKIFHSIIDEIADRETPVDREEKILLDNFLKKIRTSHILIVELNRIETLVKLEEISTLRPAALRELIKEADEVFEIVKKYFSE